MRETLEPNESLEEALHRGLQEEFGATGADKDNHAIFPSYFVGFNALKRFVILAAKNRLRDYKECTVLSFFKVYAEANTGAYALFVAKECGVLIDTKLKDFLL